MGDFIALKILNDLTDRLLEDCQCQIIIQIQWDTDNVNGIRQTNSKGNLGEK